MKSGHKCEEHTSTFSGKRLREGGSSSRKNGRGLEISEGARSERSNRESPEKPLAEVGSCDTIGLGMLFSNELTDSGSFDIRGEIWSTTFGKVMRLLPIRAELIDESHELWSWNEGWGRLTSDYQKLQDTPFADLMADRAGKDRMSRILEAVFEGRRPQVSEGILRLARGDVWARTTFRSVRIKGERFVLLLAEDLTSEKAQLEENRRLRRDLERRVEERTAQLQRTNEEIRLEILAHQKTLEALDASESRYRSVVEDQTDMIYRFLPNGALIFINPACADFLGGTPEELCRWAIFDVVPEDYRRKLKQILANLSAKNPTEEFEHLMANAQDEPRCTRWTIRTILDKEDNATAIQCVGRDITERKVAADKLHKSEELLRAIFQSTHDIILVKDRDLRITHWNPAAEALLGLNASQISGCRTEDILEPDIAAHMLELDRRVLGGEVVEVETTLPVLGTSMTFLEAKTPLLSPQGDVIGVCGIARDITYRKTRRTSRVPSENQFRSASMIFTMEQAKIAAITDSNILLQGKTVTGKDFLARGFTITPPEQAFRIKA